MNKWFVLCAAFFPCAAFRFQYTFASYCCYCIRFLDIYVVCGIFIVYILVYLLNSPLVCEVYNAGQVCYRIQYLCDGIVFEM